MDNKFATIESQLKELKLKHIAAQLDNFMLEACHLEKPNSTFLQEILQIEVEGRRKASLNKRLRVANLPAFDKDFNLDLFDFGMRQGINKRQVIELAGNFVWIDKAFNILFLGSSGLGKSYLASYLGYKAMELGYNVIFVSMNNLAQLLKTEDILTRSKAQMKRIRGCDLLILDDVGNAILDRQEANKVFQLVCDFYQQTSIIVTSNKGFEEWTQTLGDAVITTAVLDRLLHKCEIFNLNGESWRISDQQSILKNLLKAGGQ